MNQVKETNLRNVLNMARLGLDSALSKYPGDEHLLGARNILTTYINRFTENLRVVDYTLPTMAEDFAWLVENQRKNYTPSDFERHMNPIMYSFPIRRLVNKLVDELPLKLVLGTVWRRLLCKIGFKHACHKTSTR